MSDWPTTADDLVEVQRRLAADAAAALAAEPWSLPDEPAIGGCFVAFARGEAGPGHPGDRAWAAAVVWRARAEPAPARRSDHHLRGAHGEPRQADDVLAQSVAFDRVPAAYLPGLLALREGPILAAAVSGLAVAPDVLLVDATGLDHPRRAGLALHLGAVLDVPTVGVTHRALAAEGDMPTTLERGATAPLLLDGEVVGMWVCTRTGARPVIAHAGWRTDAATAARTVLAASTEAARTPVALQEARRVAREARAMAQAAGAGAGGPRAGR